MLLGYSKFYTFKIINILKDIAMTIEQKCRQTLIISYECYTKAIVNTRTQITVYEGVVNI